MLPREGTATCSSATFALERRKAISSRRSKARYAVGEAFRIIKPVSTLERRAGAQQARAQARNFRTRHRFVGALGEFLDVDADREGGKLGPAPLRNDRAIDRGDAKLVLQVVFEILPVLDGLESDQRSSEHVANDLVENAATAVMVRRSAHRRVPGKKADRAIDVELAQFDAKVRK